jgi:bifunctional DNase/RNase
VPCSYRWNWRGSSSARSTTSRWCSCARSTAIGIFEATSIDRRVQGNVPQRPLTHDLLKNAIEELGGEAQDVVVTNLVEHTYYAVIRIRKSGELIELDSRPSDAIALAVHYDPPLPIYVNEDVLGEVT